MSANKIVTSKFIKSVTKGRKTIAADHATKIDTWDRTFLAKKCIRGLHKGSREGRVTGLCCQSYLGNILVPATARITSPRSIGMLTITTLRLVMFTDNRGQSTYRGPPRDT
ncbi:hypothetical protein D6D27_10434 [Aureobasidium pullulans]|nr:hypothetical protein D6D27_10434 [Aureobasidium pullulans]